MEVRARYILMGLFTLTVILAGFSFVYWLDAAGGLGQRTSYSLRFDSPVAGLIKGSAVLFNGVRIGEVTSLTLDPAKPGDVVVEAAIDRSAPVRADTKVTIDFQGLAGAPAVSLVGGSSTLPLLSASEGASRVLTAEKNAGQSLTQAGRDVLRRFDTVVAENAAPLRSAIASIDTFSAALARNADKVDGILAGLERLTGGARKPVTRVYDLVAVQAFASLKSVPNVQLLIPEPTALANFESEKILVSGSDKTSIESAQWPDMLPRVVQARIVQSFENAKYMKVLPGIPDGSRADFQLLINIRRFQIANGSEKQAVVEIAARLVDKDGGIVGVRQFQAEAAAQSLDAPIAVKAINDAFTKVATELVLWVCTTI